MTDFGWMIAPAVACLLVAAALGWFGLHVLQRGVIFVDLALAQIAALGATYAVFLGHDPDEPFALVLSLYDAGKVHIPGHEHGDAHDHNDPHHTADPHERAGHDHGVHGSPDALPEDPLGRLDAGVNLARAGDPSGLALLASLATDEAPFIRMEAHDRLVAVAGANAPAWDPLSGPDTEGLWAAWAAAPPDGWQTRAADLPAP